MKIGALIVGILGAIAAFIGSLLAFFTTYAGAVVTNIDSSLGGDCEVVESVSANPMAVFCDYLATRRRQISAS